MKLGDVPPSIIKLLGLMEGADDWPPPENLGTALRPVPPFDPGMLPPAIRPWVQDIAHRMQCPIDYVASAALAVIGSVVGSSCGVRPKQLDDWTEVPNLWGAAVGEPGRMKTPAIAQAMAPLHALDHEARVDHDAAMAQHEIECVTRKLQADVLKKALTKSANPTQADLSMLAGLGVEPTPPKCRRYFTNDTTFESLSEVLRDNPRGLLVMHDELMGLLDGFERQGREGERQFYLTAWGGQSPHRVDRIGRGSLYIPRLTTTLYGGIQPMRLERHLYQAHVDGGGDGFFQRIQLAVYPDELSQVQIVDVAPNQAAAAIVKDIVRKLSQIDFTSLGAAVDGQGQLPYFRFELSAQSIFNRFLIELDGKVRDEDSQLIAQHLSKYRKLVPSLALIFHLIQSTSAKKPTVKRRSKITMANLNLALRWAKYLEAHARRIYGMAANANVTAAQQLAKKIVKGELTDGFSERDVYRNEWSHLREPDEVSAACRELELAGWVRRTPIERKGPGRPPTPRYQINPALINGSPAAAAPTKPTKTRGRAKH